MAPIENKLIEILGTKVKLKSSKKGGKIEISYFSIDDLDRMDETILMANEKFYNFVIEEKKTREQLSEEYHCKGLILLF